MCLGKVTKIAMKNLMTKKYANIFETMDVDWYVIFVFSIFKNNSIDMFNSKYI